MEAVTLTQQHHLARSASPDACKAAHLHTMIQKPRAGGRWGDSPLQLCRRALLVSDVITVSEITTVPKLVGSVSSFDALAGGRDLPSGMRPWGSGRVPVSLHRVFHGDFYLSGAASVEHSNLSSTRIW